MEELRIKRLIAAAQGARENAYVPYSHFAVGAAVETNDGKIFAGCNIENAAYPSSMCAERVALFSAVAAGHRGFRALAVVNAGPGLASPCGGCRQVLVEFGDGFPVIIANITGEYRVMKVADLLPAAFTGANLAQVGGENGSE